MSDLKRVAKKESSPGESSDILHVVDGMMARALSGHDRSLPISVQTITIDERKGLAEVLAKLDPLMKAISAVGRPLSDNDVKVLRIAYNASCLLSNRDLAAKALILLALCKPVPVDVARGVIQGFIASPNDLPARLRHDHPNDWDAMLLAALVESGALRQHEEAFENACSLVPSADSDEKKEKLASVILGIWQNLENAEAEKLQAALGPLLAHNDALRALADATVALRQNHADAAMALLDSHRAEDDQGWLQLRASVCRMKHDFSGAADCLLQAAKMTHSPDVLLNAGAAASEAKRYDDAAWCFNKVVESLPDNVAARNNLAHLYTFVLHDLERAAVQFRELHRIRPTELTYTLNLANCLAQLFQPKESLSLFDEVCRLDNPPLQAVIGRSRLLHALGDVDAAFEALDAFRGKFWGEGGFVSEYMSIAYAAGKERAAGEAMLALHEMQKAGSVPSETFKAVQLEEAVELFNQSFKQTQDRHEHLHKEMILGRMPWVWAAQMSNNAFYFGWRSRTSEMGWIGDEATNRARFCVYSTNGFAARRAGNGQSALMRLECPSAGTTVVADISALITLHRLGMLEAAAEFFGEVLVPVAYLPTVLEDSRRMVLHQKSIRKSAEQVAWLVQEGRIHVQPEHDSLPDGIARADEYADTTEHRYRLRDMIQPVYDAGDLSADDYALISRGCVKPSAVDEGHAALRQFQDVMVDLTTLETLAQAGLLDAAAKFYRLSITTSASREVAQRLKALSSQEETRQWHMDLWTQLKAGKRFRFVQHRVPDEMCKAEGDEKNYLAFVSCFIAQERKIPLLADDRVCQAFRLSDPEGVPCASFGTDVLICDVSKTAKWMPVKGRR